MSQFSHYEACPKCRKIGRDNRGDNLAVYRDGGVHCFACGYHKFSVLNYWKNREVKDDHVAKSLRPADWTPDVPGHAWKWLLQYGLGYDYWSPRCGYSPKEDRLVFQVGTPISFSIGRWTPMEGGELLRRERELPVVGAATKGTYRPKKWYVWGDSHRHAEVLRPAGTSNTVGGNFITLVEDIVSAHKVAQVSTCVPLFGTRLYNPHIYYLINENKPVVLWLDADQEHDVKKLAWQLESVIDQKIRVVVTPKDPKCYTTEQITKVLYG